MTTTRARRLATVVVVALGFAVGGLHALAVRSAAAPPWQPLGLPNMSGTWYVGGFRDSPIEVEQLGQAGERLVFWNTRRQFSEGRFEDPSTLVQFTATGPVAGTLAGASRIDWADGTFWTRPAPAAPGETSTARLLLSPGQGANLRFEPSGFQYRVGQLVRVCFTLPSEGRVVVTDILPDRSRWDLVNDVRPAGDYCIDWRPGPDDGRECIQVIHRVTMLQERCFQVARR